MATANEHADFVKNMDKLDKILSGTSMKGVDVSSICKTYAKARPTLVAVLPALEKIPFVGKIASTVRFLMQLADSVCKL